MIFKLYSFGSSIPGQFDSDSASYRSGNGLSNWGWVSLSGSDYGRGWPNIALYSVFKEDNGRVFLQILVSLFAWIIIGLSYASQFKSSRKRSVFLLSIFLFSNLSATQNYDNYIGRESITLSLVLLSVSSCIYLWSTKKDIFLYLVLIFSVLFSINKPTMIFVALVEWAFLFYFLKRSLTLPSIRLLHMAVIFIAIFYTFMNISNQNDGWRKSDPTGRSQTMINYSYLVSEFNPEAESLKSFFAKNGAPECAVNRESGALDNLGEPMEEAAVLLQNCKGFDSWVSKDFRPTYLKFLLLNPQSAKKIIESQVSNAFTVFPAGRSFSILPSLTNQYLLGQSLFEYWILASFVVALIGLVLHFLGGSTFSSALKFNFSLVFAFLSSIFFSLLIQPTHASDISRQNYVSQILIRLIILIFPFILSFRKRVIDVKK
jgi:hypothetical protein